MSLLFHTVSRLWRSPFQFSILCTALFFSKTIHLYNHLTSLPPLLFVLYLPTFFALDVLLAGFFWVLVHVRPCGRRSIIVALIIDVFCIVMLASSSVQIAFYLETGGEIKWGTARSMVSDPAALRLLASGTVQSLMVCACIVVTARVVCRPLYEITRVISSYMRYALTGRHSSRQSDEATLEESLDARISLLEITSRAGFQRSSLDSLETDFEPILLPQKDPRNAMHPTWFLRLLLLLPITTVLILLFVRPTTSPFAHMSASLPFTLLDALGAGAQEMCQADYTPSFVQFPMPELIAPESWESPHGLFPGWMPRLNMSGFEGDKPAVLPSWLPNEAVPGFDRWYEPDSNSSTGTPNKVFGYDPATDPLRITNLNQGVFDSIREAVRSRKLSIEHVVILNLESTRKDVFPLRKDSHLHKIIEKTYHATDTSTQEVNKALAKMSKTAELLTGEASGFGEEKDFMDESPAPKGWRGLSKKLGGLNVVGAMTGSTSTFKSMLQSHCGVQALPVDFTVEASGNIYQPCIPHILDLFNRKKHLSWKKEEKEERSSGRIDDMTSRPWKSVFVQSITDRYDHQDELNKNMGFSSVVVKSTLLDPASPRYPPTEKESNYFGFPERQVRPYLRDILRDAKKKQERLFLSHFTSSTHHPWSLPASEEGNKVDYLKRSGVFQREHELNRYLNTVRYGDEWVGEMMDILEEEEMLEKSLVVVVGDHGMAFEEDAYRHSTFENGHISNLRVPLVFYHPLLPRIQLQINATSLSIVPTILDLLVTTSSLNEQDSEAASHLTHQYEGQSLIRPFRTHTGSGKHERQNWNIGVLNAGGGFLSVSSAFVPYRLILPVCRSGGVYRFTSTDRDPHELYPEEQYTTVELAARVRAVYGSDAVRWLFDAEKIGKWWVLEQRRRWGYTGASLGEDQDTKGESGRGSIRKEHWWDT